jgi:NAD(P)-dependent dehydrogenase (short-subunit alcohol dehydrogenase family)
VHDPPRRIVYVSGQAALVALKGHISYGSSKAALDNITRISALELGSTTYPSKALIQRQIGAPA